MVQYGTMDHTTLLGIAAGTLTTIAYLPQVIKVWKTRSTHDISAGMFITLCLGLVMWTFYGLSINSMPVIIANIISLVLAFTVLVFKIRQG
ncbi:MAG: SemiSWEET transporter [Nitrospiraceae bacterium]|nr:SemiSWEET transporter [Nitrospiraceae bacterium]